MQSELIIQIKNSELNYENAYTTSFIKFPLVNIEIPLVNQQIIGVITKSLRKFLFFTVVTGDTSSFTSQL